MLNKDKNMGVSRSKVILDFSIVEHDNCFGITIGSRINMKNFEENFNKAFEKPQVRKTFNDICGNALKILKVEENQNKVSEQIKKSKFKNLPILSLNMMQVEYGETKGQYKITPYFDIDHKNIIAISNESKCMELKNYLEINKGNLQDGASIIIDVALKSIEEYRRMRMNL